ncbi:MAG: DNA-binding MarR family transcriptional regulator [Parasphingorhabdus sp.]|jgi:DNA-binding MarR family transcriptional regulator
MNASDLKEERLTLEVLSAVDRGSKLSQRSLANQMGVALGLANSYMKRCVRKGYIKISEAPANRYIYYLTPQGFSEKSRLTAQFLSSSFDFYRQAASSCGSIYRHCQNQGIDTVLLCGYSELAEIALLQAMDADIQVIGLYDPRGSKKEFFSRPVWSDLMALPDTSRVLTDLGDPLAMYRSIRVAKPDIAVLTPDVLGLHTDL